MPARIETINTVETLLTRLHECREASVYEAIERLVQAASAAGFLADDLIQMLDQGKTFEEVLAVIESRLEELQKAA